MKILIVDDNREDLALLQCIVEHHGHEAVAAVDGQEGLERAAACLPDLIISDALMPVMDGFQFLRKLKQDRRLRAIPFIFYSATYTGAKEVDLGLSLGAEAYIFKPEDPAKLGAEIERIGKAGAVAESAPDHVLDDMVLLQRYSEIVATKLEEKVLLLEKALAEKGVAQQALSQALEEWQTTFDAISDVVTIQDTAMRILRINRAGCELFGRKAEELVGKHCYELFEEHADACPCCPITYALQDGKPHHGEMINQKSGRTRIVSASPIFDEHGAVKGVVHSAKDISEQKALERQLRHAQHMEAIGTLAGGIAHDFNNILSAILGYGEIVLQDLPVGSELRSNQQEVLKAGERAKSLVRQILTFSRQTEREALPTQVHLIVKEALKLLRASIPTTIEIRQQLDEANDIVLADPTQLHQVIMNLCTNAFQAMLEKGGVLSIVMRPFALEAGDLVSGQFQLPPGPYLELAVSDTGPGMDANIMERIFEPYFTTKAKGKGTGLGLAVVHGIVTSYGGRVSVDSEQGQGTTFRVYLPRLVAAERHDPLAEEAPLPQGVERILIVDDEDSIVRVESQMLEGLGYQVIATSNAIDALQIFQKRPQQLDLIVTDMTMPAMTGLELSKRCRAIRPDIPIILCSGYSALVDQEQSVALGIDAYFQKPLTRRALAMTVRKVLDARRQRTVD